MSSFRLAPDQRVALIANVAAALVAAYQNSNAIIQAAAAECGKGFIPSRYSAAELTSTAEEIVSAAEATEQPLTSNG
jgi:hypothetical protein